jgi:tetratricopeptide (TPR) repeat protein
MPSRPRVRNRLLRCREFCYDTAVDRAKGLNAVGAKIRELRARRLDRLCLQGPAAMRAAKFEKCARIYNRALKLASGTRLSAIHRQIGICRQFQCRFDEALASYAESARVADEVGDKRGKAHALGNAGLVWQRRGDHAKALAFYEEAVRLYGELGDRLGRATARTNIGVIRRTEGDFSGAMDCLTEALEVFTGLGAKMEHASALGEIANVHMDKGELDLALVCLDKALLLSREACDRQGEVTVLGNMANVYVRTGQLARARSLYDELLKLHHELGDPNGEAYDRVGIGDVLVRKGDYIAAAGYLTQALKAFLKLGIADGPRKCLSGLRMCLTVMGVKEFSAACAKAKLEPRSVTELLEVLELRQPRVISR